MSVSTAVIGVGRFGKNYVRLLQEIEGFELAAVVARSRESLDKVHVPQDVLKTSRVNDVLTDRSIDAVVIATPVETHADLAVAALDAGKHVLLEKPMCRTPSEAKTLTFKACSSGKTFMVSHQYVYNDYVREMRKFARSRPSDQFRYFLMEHYFNSPREDCDVWLDAGTHQLSVIQFVFNPACLRYSSSTMFASKGRAEYVDVRLRVDNCFTAILRMWWRSPQRRRTFTIVGSDDMLSFDDYASENKLVYGKDTLNPKPVTINAKEPLRNELEHFRKCIVDHEIPVTYAVGSLAIVDWLDSIGRNIYNAESSSFPYGSS